ncbi:MAG: ferrous iron transport protein A [Acholeplasmatales bacterium]|nr:MAG: ferrous iron transport protein A [Acholeplasmatales bacterium]
MQATHPPISMPTVTLSTLLCGEEGTVELLPDLSLLSSLGIRMGKRVKMIAKCLANGPCILHVGDRAIVIDRAVAERIFIRK